MSDIKQPIATKSAPEAIGAYSQAIRSGEWLFLSGQIGLDPANGQLVSGGVVVETEQIMKNIAGVLAEAGGDFSSLVKVTIYLVNIADFAGVDSVYASSLVPPFPARATVGVASLPKGALVEIECIARII
jgi:2-iminobutanoate/2-iminopropanoate deaminase